MAHRMNNRWQPVRADGKRLYRHLTGVQVWGTGGEPITYRWEWLADLRAVVAR